MPRERPKEIAKKTKKKDKKKKTTLILYNYTLGPIFLFWISLFTFSKFPSPSYMKPPPAWFPVNSVHHFFASIKLFHDFCSHFLYFLSTHASHPFLPGTAHLWDKHGLMKSLHYLFYLFYLFICLFAFSRAAPESYGGSQAMGLIGAVAAGLHQSHSNAGSELHLQPTPHSSRQHLIPNPLSKARDWTRNLMVPSRIC